MKNKIMNGNKDMEMYIENAAKIRKYYKAILSYSTDAGNDGFVRSTLEKLLYFQREDGSFSVIESYHCDSDFRVDFAYMPTYYATAALMCADLYLRNGLNTKERDCLKKGLHFAVGRNLVGHGYEATETLIRTLRLYAKAGMYKWINLNADISKEFKTVVDKHYSSFVKALEEGKTFSDWNKDFAEDFKREVAEYEAYNQVYVWYAAYGSNINEDRFMKYINSCSDKSTPKESRAYIFRHKMYFGGMSRIWNGSVAFLDVNNSGRAFGKIYLIKKCQFEEIQSMEGNSYNKRVRLENIDNVPVYTFTSERRLENRAMPSSEYLNVIFEGLKSISDKSEMALEAYLYTRGFLQKEDLQVLECIRNSAHAVTVGRMTDLTGICKTKIRRSVKELHRCGLIVQDSRSGDADINDDHSMVYTNKDKREMIDVLTMVD